MRGLAVRSGKIARGSFLVDERRDLVGERLAVAQAHPAAAHGVLELFGAARQAEACVAVDEMHGPSAARTPVAIARRAVKRAMVVHDDVARRERRRMNAI